MLAAAVYEHDKIYYQLTFCAYLRAIPFFPPYPLITLLPGTSGLGEIFSEPSIQAKARFELAASWMQTRRSTAELRAPSKETKVSLPNFLFLVKASGTLDARI